MRKSIILLGIVAIVLAVAEAKNPTIKGGSSTSRPTFMDTLMMKAFEYIRVLLKGKPFTVPKDVHERITDPQFNVDVKLGSITLTNADDFVINKIHNDVAKLTADFDLTLPHPTISGIYSIDGVAAGHKFSGSGKFSIYIENFNQKGFIQMKVKDKSLYMDTLNLDFSLSASKWDLENMRVEGITQQQASDFMNKNLISTLNARKTEICARFGEQIKLRANKLLAGKTLFQIIQWLNKFIKG